VPVEQLIEIALRKPIISHPLSIYMTVTSQKAAHSVLWSCIEQGSLAIVSFVCLVVYSRLLTEAEFGLFSIVLAIIELLSVLVTMLFHDALVQRRDASNLSFDTAFTATVVLSLGLTVAAWAAAPLFERMVQQTSAAWILALAALTVPLQGVSATLVAEQRRQLQFRPLALRSLAGRLLGALIGIVAATVGAGVWSLVAQQLVTALVGSLVLWISCDRRPRFDFSTAECRQLATFGIFSVASIFLLFSTKRLFTIFAGLGLGLTAAGYLNLSFRIVDVLWAVLATAVSQVALPMMSGLQGEPERVKRAYKKAVEFACLALYPCFVGIAVTAPEIVEAVFGTRWLPSIPAIVALCCLALVQAPRLYVSPILTAVGRPKDAVVGSLAELIFMIAVATACGLPNLTWAIGVWIASECIQIPITVILMQRATGYRLRDQFGGIVTPLLSVTVMALSTWLARMGLGAETAPHIKLVIISAVGAATYVAAIAVFDRPLAHSFIGFVRSSVSSSRS
jgi:O-antigen/teichoic acid export membrane protein